MQVLIQFKTVGYEFHIGDSATSQSAYWFGFTKLWYCGGEVVHGKYYPYIKRGLIARLKLRPKTEIECWTVILIFYFLLLASLYFVIKFIEYLGSLIF